MSNTDSTTLIHLSDVGVTLTVPIEVMPFASGGSAGHLENYLGSLYLTGNDNCDSYDVGLSLAGTHSTISGVDGVPTIDRKPPTDRKLLRKGRIMQLLQDNTNLTSRLEALETSNFKFKVTINTLLHNHIYDCEKALKQARFIEEFETYSRIIQSLNDNIFSKINSEDRAALCDKKLDYITRLFELPLPQGCYKLVECTLSLLDKEELSALDSLLPIFYSLKDGSYGRNSIQHPSPTVDQALAQIQQSSSLSDEHKATLSAIIRRNRLSSKGVPLFRLSNSPTEVRDLEERIEQLKSQLDLFNS